MNKLNTTFYLVHLNLAKDRSNKSAKCMIKIGKKRYAYVDFGQQNTYTNNKYI